MGLPAPTASGVRRQADLISAARPATAAQVFDQALEQNARRTLALGSTQTFVPGESTPSNLGAQVALLNVGFNITGDGVWGPRSQAALDSFRRQRGLPLTGRGPNRADGTALYAAYQESVAATEAVRIDQRAASILRMGRAAPIAEDGVRGPATRRAVQSAVTRPPAGMGLQLALSALGYELAIDGAVGPETRGQLARFRADYGVNASGNASAADARALFAALQEHYRREAARDLEVHHNFFRADGRVARAVRLSTLRQIDAQFREANGRTEGGLFSRHYTIEELFGTGANSRPSLNRLGRLGVHGEMLRMLDRATDEYREITGNPNATLNRRGGKEILSTDRGYPSNRHRDGWAVDIGDHGGMNLADRRELVEAFLRAGATSVGVYPWGVHADVDPRRMHTTWADGVSNASLSPVGRYWR
ncbi:MAG: peptidoglycan-binding protein [Myxococcota bacterium]